MATIGAAAIGSQEFKIASESAGAGAPFDYQKLMDEWNGNEGLLLKLLETFHREAVADLAALEAAFGANDLTQVARRAHRIKGSAAVIGALQVHNLAATIEAHGRRCELSSCLVNVDMLRTELKRCQDFVASLES